MSVALFCDEGWQDASLPPEHTTESLKHAPNSSVAGATRQQVEASEARQAYHSQEPLDLKVSEYLLSPYLMSVTESYSLVNSSI